MTAKMRASTSKRMTYWIKLREGKKNSRVKRLF